MEKSKSFDLDNKENSTYLGRLSMIMRRFGLNNKKLAEICGCTAASISKMFLTGKELTPEYQRNLKKEFPELNMNWLIIGEGRMILDGTAQQQPAPAQPQGDTQLQELKLQLSKIEGKFEYAAEINTAFINRIENHLKTVETALTVESKASGQAKPDLARYLGKKHELEHK
jgi:hypothetical protein